MLGRSHRPGEARTVLSAGSLFLFSSESSRADAQVRWVYLDGPPAEPNDWNISGLRVGLSLGFGGGDSYLAAPFCMVAATAINTTYSACQFLRYGGQRKACCYLLRRFGPAIKVALRGFAAHHCQPFAHFLRFHAFGSDTHAKSMR